MNDRSTLLLEHHLKELKLPSFLREYGKMAAQCAVDGQRKCPLSPSALGVRARLRDLTDMAEVKEAPIDYPGRLRRSVEGVGVLYKTEVTSIGV